MRRVVFAAGLLIGSFSTAWGDDVLDYGQYLAGECTGCHTSSSKDVGDTGIPPLADISGWDKESFIGVMKAFQTGERDNPAMGNVAKALDDDQLTALATYFATLKEPDDPPQTAAAKPAAPAATTSAAKTPAGKAAKPETLKKSIVAQIKKIEASGELRFKPSYITAPHRKLTPEDWTDPRICGQCHSRQYEGWKGSMHANSFKDPVFQALWAIGEKATNGRFRNHCAGCHSPIGTVTNTIKFDPKLGKHGGFTAPPMAANGVSCDVCHTIKGTNVQRTATLEHGNASIILDPGNVKRGSLKNSSSPYHDTAYSPLHTSSKFCGNCHNIFHPENKFPIERTYDEWKYSIYAQNGIQCMDCHMVPVSTAIRVADELKRPHDLKDSQIGGFAGLGGPWRKVVHDHYFVGGNAVVTAALQGKKSLNYEQAIQRLKSAASLKLFIKPRKTPGLHRLKLRVTNERAGHNLPTSLTEVRQIWIEIVVHDEKGNELLRSGTLTDKRALPEDTVIFNAQAVDKDGKHTEYPWEVTRFITANTIPPRGYKYGKYSFYIPPDTKSIKVTARLHYRSFSQKLADLLLGKGKLIVPSVEMVALEKSYKVDHRKVSTGPAAGHGASKATAAGGATEKGEQK